MKNIVQTKTLSLLLAFAMLLSLVPGMGLTALAYNGNPYASLVESTTTVKFNNIDWYIIADDSTAVDAGTVTLLAKEPICASKFHGSSNAYSSSTVKTYLDSLTATGGAFADVADAIVSTDLEDVTVTGAKLWLLSTSEAKELTQDVRKCSQASGAENKNWWLRSPGNAAGKASCMFGWNGYLDDNGYSVTKEYGVRPALKLDLSKVTFVSVNLSGGANATVSGGSTTQAYFNCGSNRSEMTPVTYTASDGYKFPKTSAAYGTTNDITVTRTSDTVITVSGTPTATATSIAVPDAKSEVDEITWEGSILNSLTDSNGITVTGDGIAYAAAGLMFEQHRGPINFSASNGYFTKIVITCNELENSSGATISGFTQSGNTLTWTGESANVTIPQNGRGLSLYGVTSIKFTGVGLIPTVDKSALETAITAAETLYDSIKDDTDYSTIASTLKTAIDTAKEVADSATADQDAVDTANGAISDATTTAVVGMINALPASTEVTTSDKDKIEAVRAAYDNLTDAQKESFDTDTLKKLTDAETALQDAIDTETAQGATDTINALPAADKVTTADKDAIEAARKAYNDLTDDQKKKVSDDTLKKLTDAEDALKAAGVSDTINTLPAADEVTTADKDAIEKARKAYNDLTDDQKKKVSDDTLKKLTDAEDALKAAGVSDTINALPAADEVTTADKDAIEKARKAYDALTDEQKAYVPAETLKKLTDDESALAVATANEAINALPAADEVTTANKDAIEAARKAYDALTDEEKEKIAPETLKKLTDAESALAVAEANKAISELPAADKVTTADKNAIEAARKAYDALTDEEKAQIAPETLKKLTDAEDALATATVSDEIKALPAAAEVTTDNKAAIAAARKAYDALTDEQKAYVAPETLKKLTDAETALAVAEANKAISELPDADKVTLADKDAIEVARKAYDALTDEEKAKIAPEMLKKLTDAESALAVVEVNEAINALPASGKVTMADKAAIKAARAAYDALSADQKARVSSDTLKKLTDAEAALAAAENATSPQTGDNSHMGLWIAIMILSLCALATMLFIGKKKRGFDR